jgi:hypothetical protein
MVGTMWDAPRDLLLSSDIWGEVAMTRLRKIKRRQQLAIATIV